MYQFYIIEIQKNANGDFGHNVFWEYDASEEKARLKAESKYYTVLAAAAISELPEHACILFSSDGTPMMNQCYKHTVEEPEEEVDENS